MSLWWLFFLYCVDQNIFVKTKQNNTKVKKSFTGFTTYIVFYLWFPRRAPYFQYQSFTLAPGGPKLSASPPLLHP